MADAYIIYPDQHSGWENTLWQFVRGAWDGNDIPTGSDVPSVHVRHFEYTIKAREGTVNEWTSKLEDGNCYYNNNAPVGAGKFAGYIEYDSPTTGFAHISYNGFRAIGADSIEAQYYQLHSALSGTVTTNNGIIIDLGDHATDFGAINYGATIGLSAPQSLDPDADWQIPKNATNTILINASFPIFKDYNALKAYIISGDLSGCINLKDKYELQTKPYFIYNQYGVGVQSRGSVTLSVSLAWRSLKLLANEQPVLYYDADGYGLTLIADDLVSSVSAEKPGYMLDLIPQSQWTDGLSYTGKFWGTFDSRNRATGKILPDGTYTYYGFSFSTNMYVFKDKATADKARRTKDYSEAENYEDLENRGKKVRPRVGPDAGPTEFGNGADTSPFMNMYAMSRTTIAAIANEWYNTDGQILQNILDGLKMYSNPTDAIAGLTWYPFDLSDILVTSSQNFINFGSYRMNLTGSVDHVDGMKSGAYLDCGSIFLEPLFYSYRDFPPYTSVSVFLPFIGWRDIDIRPLIGKNVSIRYYVDVHTRACTACILANNVFIYQFDGTIGVSLPISAPDFQGYANSALNAILGGAKDMFGIGNTAAQVGGSAGPVGAAAVAALGTGVNTTKTMFELEKLGQPRDHLITKGAFTSGIGAYLPKTIYWRYDIHQPMEPADFNALYGRPSTASGTVGSFSGFLKCKTAKLNTGGMLDAEADEVAQLLKSGVFV